MTLDLAKLREVAELAVQAETEYDSAPGDKVPAQFDLMAAVSTMHHELDPQTVLALLNIALAVPAVIQGDCRHEIVGHRASGTSPSLMKLREAFREMQQPESDNG